MVGRSMGLLKSAAGTCHFCHQKHSVLPRSHSQRRRTYETGFEEMVALSTARDHTFDEKSLRLSLAEVVHRSYGDGSTVKQALEEG